MLIEKLPQAGFGGEELHTTFNPEVETNSELTAERARQALAEHYQQPIEDFGLVVYQDTDGDLHKIVMYIAQQGLEVVDSANDYGADNTFVNFMATDRHLIEIDGYKFDTRTLSGPAYRAFIAQQTENGVDRVPDSQDLDEWTSTLLPSSWSPGVVARVDKDHEGNVFIHQYLVLAERANFHIRFRPGLILQSRHTLQE